MSGYLQAHLNLVWLRPESALWDAVASTLVSRYRIESPSLDLGCGSGLFSFITSGGRFSLAYDVYNDLSARGFWQNRDIYDAAPHRDAGKYIVKRPQRGFDFGLDHKQNLLKQAGSLDYYKSLRLHDANKPLPFCDGQLRTVFSNMLYWLKDPRASLKEVHRVLDKEGRAIVCVPNTAFTRYCASYRWAEKKSRLLKMLNRGRSQNLRWVISYKSFRSLAQRTGFSIQDHRYYLSPLILKFWDVGLRPLSPLLIKMTGMLNPRERLAIKKEWMRTVLNFIEPLYKEGMTTTKEGGFHLFLLKKQP